MLDANANRAAEGLRVLEDVARFLIDDAVAARKAKELRHRVRSLVPDDAVAARASDEDVLAATTLPGDGGRPRLIDLIRANAARAQEALRAAEEAARLLGAHDPGANRIAGGAVAAGLEQARYGAYHLESALLSRLPGWLFWRVRLYVLVDPALCADVVATAAAAAKGGAGAIPLRAKELAPRAYRDLAARVQDAVRHLGTLFIVNDHVAVAKALGADGIHVGQDDLAPADVRAVVGPTCALGLSAHTADQAAAAISAGADYLGLGPMFPTATKPHEPARGPELLDHARALFAQPGLTRPSYAIGGLTAARIRDLRPRLPHGVAVTAAVCSAPDPQAAAEELHRILEPEDA
jgi:thiamine-phosphate pyrophosphorylase